jgi:hypothetical protein
MLGAAMDADQGWPDVWFIADHSIPHASIRAAVTDWLPPPTPRSIPASEAPTRETSAGRPRRSAGAGRPRLGVRRPITQPMPLERREQAIVALTQLILAGLERDAAALDADRQGRGRVVNRSRQAGSSP